MLVLSWRFFQFHLTVSQKKRREESSAVLVCLDKAVYTILHKQAGERTSHNWCIGCVWVVIRGFVSSFRLLGQLQSLQSWQSFMLKTRLLLSSLAPLLNSLVQFYPQTRNETTLNDLNKSLLLSLSLSLFFSNSCVRSFNNTVVHSVISCSSPPSLGLQSFAWASVWPKSQTWASMSTSQRALVQQLPKIQSFSSFSD